MLLLCLWTRSKLFVWVAFDKWHPLAVWDLAIVILTCAVVVVRARGLGLTQLQLIFLMQDLIHLLLAIAFVWLDMRVFECWLGVFFVTIALLEIIAIGSVNTNHSHILIEVDAWLLGLLRPGVLHCLVPHCCRRLHLLLVEPSWHLISPLCVQFWFRDVRLLVLLCNGVRSSVIVDDWFLIVVRKRLLIIVCFLLTCICFLYCRGSVNLCLWNCVGTTRTAIYFFFDARIDDWSKSLVFAFVFHIYLLNIELLQRLLMRSGDGRLLVAFGMFSQSSCAYSWLVNNAGGQTDRTHIIISFFTYLICDRRVLVFWKFITMAIRCFLSVSILHTAFNIRQGRWLFASCVLDMLFLCSISQLIVFHFQLIEFIFLMQVSLADIIWIRICIIALLLLIWFLLCSMLPIIRAHLTPQMVHECWLVTFAFIGEFIFIDCCHIIFEHFFVFSALWWWFTFECLKINILWFCDLFKFFLFLLILLQKLRYSDWFVFNDRLFLLDRCFVLIVGDSESSCSRAVKWRFEAFSFVVSIHGVIYVWERVILHLYFGVIRKQILIGVHKCSLSVAESLICHYLRR